jgi:AAA family ATP:ADP antiporter
MATIEPGARGAVRRLLLRFAKVEARESAVVVAAFLLFFFVLGSYFAVRPVRETIATELGRKRVADLWLYTALFSIAIVPVYGWLVGHVRRGILLPWIYGSVALVLTVLGFLLGGDGSHEVAATVFYVWISVLNLMLVSVFWSFLLEMFSSEQARRLFGVIAAGGTAGALVGPLSTRLIVDHVGNSGVLYLGAAGFVGAIACQRVLLRIWTQGVGAAVVPASARGVDVGRGIRTGGLGGNPFAGVVQVLRSPYLLGIALFVVLLSTVNTFLYFEQLRIVEETFASTTRRTEVFANIDIVVQALTIFSQLFLTGSIAKGLGVRALLTFVPLATLVGFLVLSAFNSFIVIAIVLMLRRWGEYAFIRPGREMLFSRLDTETKYKAKNFIDVPVYRAADFVGAQAKGAIEALGAAPMAVALIGAVVAAAWGVNGWMLGRHHDRADAEDDMPPAAAGANAAAAQLRPAGPRADR